MRIVHRQALNLRHRTLLLWHEVLNITKTTKRAFLAVLWAVFHTLIAIGTSLLLLSLSQESKNRLLVFKNLFLKLILWVLSYQLLSRGSVDIDLISINKVQRILRKLIIQIFTVVTSWTIITSWSKLTPWGTWEGTLAWRMASASWFWLRLRFRLWLWVMLALLFWWSASCWHWLLIYSRHLLLVRLHVLCLWKLLLWMSCSWLLQPCFDLFVRDQLFDLGCVMVLMLILVTTGSGSRYLCSELGLLNG